MAPARRGWSFALVLLILVVGVRAPAWGQQTPVGPPPLVPLPAPPAPEPAPRPEGEPRPPGEGERPGAEEAPSPPEPPRITAPPPPAFEFIQRELARPDLALAINPLDVPRHFFLRAILSVVADDNVRLAPPGQKQGDVGPILSLAGEYRFETARTYLHTANSISARYSPNFSDLRGISFGNLNLTAGHQFTPRFSLGVSEGFAASTDLLQSNFSTTTGAVSAAQSGTSKFLTNSVSPQATYLLSDQTNLTVRYANTIVQNLGSSQGTGNSTINTLGGTFSHSLSQRTSMNVGYSHLINNSPGNNEIDDYLTAAASYVLSPRTTLSLNASAAFTNPESNPNQNIYGLSLGAGRALSPTFSAAGSVGFQVFQGGGQVNVHPTFSFSFSKIGLRYQITGSGSLATTQNIGQVNNVGLTRNLTFLLNYTYFPSQVWFFNLQATYQRTNFEQAQQAFLLGIQPSTIDTSYYVAAAVNYRLARSLFLTLSYTTVVQDSTQPGRNVWDNRGTLGFTAQIAR